MTRDCFEPGLGFFVLRLLATRCEGFAAGIGSADNTERRFFMDFDIEILRSVQGGVAPHHRSPASAIKPAGQDPKRLKVSELTKVPLCLLRNASPFWIILLLISAVLEYQLAL